MSVGVIGLLPDQVNTIKAAFPQLNLHFLPREREREARDFATRMTKVVLMTKFIGHPTQNAVPTHKRVPVSGGMSKLRAALEQLKNTPALTPVKKQAPVVHHKEPEAMTQHAEKKVNYKKLVELPVGGTLELHRPARTTIAKWEQQITTARSYYRRNYGVVTDVTYNDGVATIRVKERREPTDDVAGAREAKAAETSAVKYTESEAELWTVLFMSRTNRAHGVAEAAAFADQALEAFRQRFSHL